jgi:O-antigen/teichoic acid export membrane protein
MSSKKNIIALIGGSISAQIITIGISPFLTRLYSPKEFGILAIYISLSSLLAVFASCRYDMSLIEPKKDEDARGLMFLSIKITLFFCVLLYFIIEFSGADSILADLIGSPDIKIWINILPLTVFCISCQSIFSHWLNRLKMFNSMSTSRIINSSGIGFVSLFLAFTSIQSYGLILGFIIGQFIPIIYLWFKCINQEMNIKRTCELEMMRVYIRYPKYLMPSTFAGGLAIESTVIILTRFYDASVTGLFSLVNRIISTPMSIIGNSIGEVYRVGATANYNKYGECKEIFIKYAIRLSILGLIPFFILFMFGEELITFVFGDQWRGAGEMAKILSFAVWFQLISTPLSYTIALNKSLNLDLYLQIFRLIGSIGAMIMGLAVNNYIVAIQLYSLTYCLYYFAHTCIQFRAAKGTK